MARTFSAAAGSLVGFLVGLACASRFTRHLALGEDPPGLIGTWAVFLVVCTSVGGGQLIARSFARRGAGS